jgi:hypothetical protein
MPRLHFWILHVSDSRQKNKQEISPELLISCSKTRNVRKVFCDGAHAIEVVQQ